MSYGSTNLQINLNAVDNASSTISRVGSSTKSLVLSFNNVASSALNLYNMVDRVRDSQVALDRANLIVIKSAESVRDAQNNLTKVLEKFGEGSEQAVDAQNRLELAQESYKVATERADMAAENQRKTMMTMAVSVIPTLITGISGLAGPLNDLNIMLKTAKKDTDNLAASFTGLGGMGGGMGVSGFAGAIVGAVGLATAIGLATKTMGDFYEAQQKAYFAENPQSIAGKIRGGGALSVGNVATNVQESIKQVAEAIEQVNMQTDLGGQVNWAKVAAIIAHAEGLKKLNEQLKIQAELEKKASDAATAAVAALNAKQLAAQTVFDNLVRTMNVEKAREAGKDFVDAYTEAWESSSMIRAIAVAIRFANAMKIDLQDAVNILDELMRKIEEPAEAAKAAAGGYDWQNLGGTGPVYGLGPGQIMPSTLLGPAAQYAAGRNVTDIIINAGTPLSYKLEFYAPLVTVIGGGGGVDKQNLKMVAGMIQESLKRVVIETSSPNAPASEKQIRISSDVSVPGVQMATQISRVGTLLRTKLAEGRAW